MDLSIIIVSWNVKEKLKENLKALYNSRGEFKFKVFVVDNNSSDKTVDMVEKEFPQAKLIANPKNFGFAKSNNQAIKIANGDFILLLNPDMMVEEDTLKNMIAWMRENKQASVAGCRLLDESGKIINHVRQFPAFWDQAAIALKLPHLFPNILHKYLRKDFDYSQAQKIDSIRGGFFMIRREAIEKAGLLDERYFLWFEEVDYCRQVYKKGGEVWYAPVAECIDFVGQSFKQVEIIKKQKYFRDSQLKYFKKWHSAWQYYILKIIWPVGLLITIAIEKFGFKSRTKT
ncbi:hypothetical protein CO115_01290 [Candidatus Falkowbacteria bacterium CG_4_9_14_3_um_filter_36_9]|uniref:Glycosyltransferase 2-like domain-containing protein n=1 Tax=Candidatus Falkowbacteria bacterium CG02_land_8_20_14_3_00_36_14 TaxID=1974560 RepID=A0A2M7DLB0_9BACT|nr:MAG: hypothetical protein COS18_04695 [Candidatus Falkowbacteria bacterium CG02_land_8_20_14_3_00_36_14]PIX11282.1 MAG: hypothetical protein COZ73_03020 [Candidatus Falkowbacteria bacterium CG_4_8_14_3_um_filter_36_11]PJA11039.1 MAG: hypothetical protein COX67_01910 [Candidatus Falkowbacteria bacterium CG_4_10_14_0_2_um_filter_36_22]PJB20422.1 MAG: hypothetical protein CO115_01290 [Candidatus Falkowbacteria bacterium CG_4_9_14_3_um_filter_36_9]